MLKAIIFDLNGVFLKSEFLTDRIQKTYNIPVEESLEILKPSMKVVRQPNAPSIFPMWQPLFEKHGIAITEEEFFRFWFGGEGLVNELIDYVKQLRQNGTKVFILSNNFRERTTYYRKYFPEIFENVDQAYFSWETGFVKPDEKAFLNVLEQNELNPSEVLFFDDSEQNVEVAKDLGIDAYVFEGIDDTKETVREFATAGM
jgi:HAD superfamily hydrolase (TIGR01509 family)